MKSITLFLLAQILFSTSDSVKSDYFTGYIKHRHYYKSEKLDADSLNMVKSKGDIYFFNDQFYKGYTFSKDTSIFIYNSKKNQSIYFKQGDDSFRCIDYSVSNSGKLKKWYVEPSKTKILGYDCNTVVLEYDDMTCKYHISDKFKLNPSLYVNHTAYGYDERMRLTKGQTAIRTEIIYDLYTMVIEIEDYKKIPMSSSEFAEEWFEYCK